MKAIIIVCVIAALMIICGVICCLCAEDGDDFGDWSEDDENDMDRTP